MPVKAPQRISLPSSFPRGSSLAVCLLAGLAGIVLSTHTISLLPPGIESRHLEIAGASTLVVVDRPRPLISDRLATDGDYQTLQKRSVLLANVLTSAPAMRRIAERAGIDARQIATVTRITANVQSVLTEPDSEQRANDIRDSRLPYRLEVQPDATLPSFNIYTQAPTPDEAARLADAAVPGLRAYESELAAASGGADPEGSFHLEQIGPARAAVISGKSPKMIAALAFMFCVGLTAALLAIGRQLRRDGILRRGGLAPRFEPPVTDPPRAERDPAESRRRVPGAARAAAARLATAPALTPAVALAPAGAGGALGSPAAAWQRAGAEPRAPRSERAGARLGDWPRTTRVLPWMIAVMLAVIWLVPFNTIQLSASLPIDLKFDRLVLPFVFGVWVLALAAGGRHAPRIRMTWIHVGVLALIGVACLSLVLDAPYLNQTLEFETAAKKLVLLGSYVMLFFIVASVVRRREVPAFMTYMLVLATLCALGTIWEYRFHYNVFYALSDQLLPGIFQVGAAESSAIDDIGRRVVRGPGELPLEAVAMIAMGLPLAVVRLIGASETRKRVMYGLCVALMIAGALATYRKSAFIAPISVFLTLAYFRRRELVRLSPLGLVLIVMIPVISPGAVGSVLGQLSGNRLHVATVSDRSSDYDAVRPDVWTNLAFGRGYGSYEHTSYRILDMELLRQLIEVGALGLAAYIFVIFSIVGVARGPIRRRSPTEAPIALAAAAAAVAFLVVSTLFDVMSFPHTPYLLLITAALLAVVVTTRDEEDEVPAWS